MKAKMRVGGLLLVTVLTMLALTACNGDKPKNGLLEQGAMLYVNVKSGDLKSMDDKDKGKGLLTPREIVETASIFRFHHPVINRESNVSIADVQKDVENARIKMWGEQVINEDGTLNEYFIMLRDLRIVAPFPKDENGNYIETDRDNVTGYIPNAVMEKAERDIRKAYKEGRYDDVYKLFQDAYTAKPINLDMWLELKAQGKQ